MGAFLMMAGNYIFIKNTAPEERRVKDDFVSIGDILAARDYGRFRQGANLKFEREIINQEM